jgi:hypothetical protein
MYKFDLILNYKKGNPLTENGYGHTSAAQDYKAVPATKTT